jgi:hypothetical protein
LKRRSNVLNASSQAHANEPSEKADAKANSRQK